MAKKSQKQSTPGEGKAKVMGPTLEKSKAGNKDEGKTGMQYQVEKKNAPDWGEVEVLGATFEEGKPKGEELGRWRTKLTNREERLKYLETGERYWYSKDWYGSEKRKNPA